MEINMRGLPFDTTYYELKEELAKVFLGEDSFFYDPNDRRLNFEVYLNYVDDYQLRNDGNGWLYLPTKEVGGKFLKLLKEKRLEVKIRSRFIRFFNSRNKVDNALVETLLKVPYQDPAIEKERYEKLNEFHQDFRINMIQFGIWAKRPVRPNRGLFCAEWERPYTSIGNALIKIEFDDKLIRVKIGDAALDEIAYSIVIKFSSVKDMWVGFDYGNPFVSFDLLTPAVFECEWFNRTTEDDEKFRQRVGCLDPEHARVSPYAHQILLTLYQDKDLEEFARLCKLAGLRDPQSAEVESQKHGFFTSKKLKQIEKLLSSKSVPFRLAFQVESLLHSGLIHSDNLLDELWVPISDLTKDYPDRVADILRLFVREMSTKRPPFSDVLNLFKQFCTERLEISANSPEVSENLMNCLHVTFTPTRMTLEGPYGIQSNRVIRKYVDYQDHFLRVDFRDEDRLQYRWDRAVDGTTFLQERVGTLLKEGFDLAGRHFDFLAYSSSALRSHAVWFMSPFQSKTGGFICAATIRRDLGDFSKIINLPSKYAARLALAFTATDATVEIGSGRWKETDDMMDSTGRAYTDGIGTISKNLGEKIWDKLCANNAARKIAELVPSQYLIRFLGFKGVVVEDELLSDSDMCLRASMKKFLGDETKAVIEVANVFNRPKPMYLNRPLIMILEDRGVRKEVFLELQRVAIAYVLTAYDSADKLADFMHHYNFCPVFKLSKILLKLSSAYKLCISRNDLSRSLSTPFMDRIARTVINSALRDIKYRARISVPNSWNLVGVADEGAAYEGKPGFENILLLAQGEIFVCIKDGPNHQSRYLKGQCVVSRSPTLHPGDVQTLWAIGKPPESDLCFFRNLKNCVVFNCKDHRSMPSCLGGGDLDGDEYNVSEYRQLLPARSHDPAEYQSLPPREIDIDQLRDSKGIVDRERVIPHVCDFIVEYINSDVLGLLSDNHLVRADQSSEGVLDKGCIKLAELCSQAVDYPKNGVPVDTRSSPRRLIKYKPDWKEGEEDIPRKTDFYRSERAIGYMYRAIKDMAVSDREQNMAASTHSAEEPDSLEAHPVYAALLPHVAKALITLKKSREDPRMNARQLFRRYADDLQYICRTHTLTDHPGVQLTEEEVVVGTILAQCSQHRWRSDRMYAMRTHSRTLVYDVRKELLVSEGSSQEYMKTLDRAWETWKFAVQERIDRSAGRGNTKDIFGLNSFEYIALNVVLDSLEKLQ